MRVVPAAIVTAVRERVRDAGRDPSTIDFFWLNEPRTCAFVVFNFGKTLKLDLLGDRDEPP